MKVRQFVEALSAEITAEMEKQLPTRADVVRRKLQELERKKNESGIPEETYELEKKRIMAFSREMEEQQSNKFTRKLLKNTIDVVNRKFGNELVSPATLMTFVEYLRKQSLLMASPGAISNCVPNASPTSFFARGGLILARHLHKALDQSMPGYDHPYDYLFGKGTTARFKSAYGAFGDMPLNGFLWVTRTIIKDKKVETVNYPMDVVGTIDLFRKADKFEFPHACLKEEDFIVPEDSYPSESKVTCSPSVTDDEMKFISAHSYEARDYYLACANGNIAEEAKDKLRQALVEVIARPDFIPGYSYPKSCQVLIKNGLFGKDHFNVNSLNKFGKMLAGNVEMTAWRAFVDCIHPDSLDEPDVFDALVLPSLPVDVSKKMDQPIAGNIIQPNNNNAPSEEDRDNEDLDMDLIVKRSNNEPPREPDFSLLCNDAQAEGKLIRFIKDKSNYNLKDLLHIRAVIFLLDEFMWRNRDKLARFLGYFGQVTGYSDDRELKVAAIKKHQDFITDTRYYPHQLSDYLEENDPKFNAQYLSPLTSGKTKALHEMAVELMTEILQGSVKVDVKNAEIFDRGRLWDLARRLCEIEDKKSWEAIVKEVIPNMNALSAQVQTYTAKPLESIGVTMFLRFIKDKTVTRLLEQYYFNCIRFQGHYILNNNKHNRAMIFVWALFYEWMRTKSGVINDTAVGEYTNAPKFNEKICGVRMVIKFLVSDAPLNKFDEFVASEFATGAYKDEVKAAILKAINDSATSKLMSLIQLMQDVCTVDFYRKPEVEVKPSAQEESQEASGGGFLSYFGFNK